MLAAGEWRATLRPEIGGSIASLSVAGLDVLRPMPDAATDPLHSACFPLVPYANRIRGGRFAFGGRSVEMPRNFLPQLHSLHGIGWQRPWRLTERGEAEALLVDEYDGTGAWPWAWRAEQHVALDEAGLSIVLTLINRSGRADARRARAPSLFPPPSGNPRPF